MTHPNAHAHRIGLNRREILQVGYSLLLGVSATEAVQAAPRSLARSRPKSVILVFLPGASSHIDTFDPKPDAPVEIRGEFKAVGSAVPGILVGEHLPLLAARSKHY